MLETPFSRRRGGDEGIRTLETVSRLHLLADAKPSEYNLFLINFLTIFLLACFTGFHEVPCKCADYVDLNVDLLCQS